MNYCLDFILVENSISDISSQIEKFDMYSCLSISNLHLTLLLLSAGKSQEFVLLFLFVTYLVMYLVFVLLFPFYWGKNCQ